MADLRNTIAHILEHRQYLAKSNEATIQQYVVLPILRALGWDDTNLASMEVLPEYKVESRRADYALHVKRDESPAVLIECKRWNQPIGRNEEQICFYAYSGNVPLAIITNGKLWRFYLSRWEAPSLSDRIFCETDIESRESGISDLEKYLLKSNVASGEAELNAEITLEEKEKPEPSKPVPVRSETSPVNDTITSDPKSSTAKKFREANTLEDRVEIGRKVAALRINAAGSSGMAWRKIREELRRTEGLHLKQEDLREVIRREDHFKESVVECIESFEGGWECQGDLTVLCGFEPVGELANRIEACKPKPAPNR